MTSLNSDPGPQSYDYYREALAGRRLPLAFVDLDLLEENARALVRRAAGKRLRLASKSVRCVDVLNRVLRLDPTFAGILCFSVPEAVHLATHGVDDLLVAYPTCDASALRSVSALVRQGHRIVLTIDSPDHLSRVASVARDQDTTLEVCLDLDLSSLYPGLRFGVYRSPLRTPEQALELAAAVREADGVRLVGLLGYEAQIAGLADEQPRRRLRSLLIRMLKQRSTREVRARRGRVVAALREAGYPLDFVNGGGTGSVELTASDPAVTEVAVGSGLFGPHLFDGYRRFRHRPAAAFALEITRRPAPGIFTCLGGGYVASGASGRDRLPTPYLPPGARLLATEGAGEVQTPVAYAGDQPLSLGDPIFMRHAKSGELCEHFTHLLLIRDGRVVDEVATYRGEGKRFP